MDRIRLDGVVSLDVLVNLLNTSESTVRRDLEELAAAKLLRRVHGGAENIQSLQEELSIQQKAVKNVQDKQKLAVMASQLISDGDVIFLDAGSSTALLIDLLVGKKITVVTNSIAHASQLVDKGLDTIIIGGTVKPSTNVNIGLLATEQINQLHFDKAFLGINGIDDNAITTPDMAEAMIKKAIIKNAKTSYVLADSSKLEQVSFVKVAEVAEVTIITNQSKVELIKLLKEKTQVITV